MRRLLILTLGACDPSRAPIDYPVVEDGCVHTNGELTTRKCCEGTLDYPDVCSQDPCTCRDDASWSVLYCQCGVGACFDGSGCVLEREL